MDTPAAPAWFRDAIATAPEQRTVRVKGCDIHYLRWGDVERPGLVLVHGGAAHAHWWSFIAPLLLPHHHVIALDLAGHGDSGHSRGGLVAIAAGSLHGERLAGVVVVDSPVRRPDPESEEGERGRMFRNPKVYADLETAVAHFHLAPPQPCDND